MSRDPEYYRDTRDDGRVGYWRLDARGDAHWARGEWRQWTAYKSGPSWWRLTGEIGIDRIDPSELPPEIPQ
jgi:hypothetical protein